MMTDHSHYEELAALAAGGLLSDEERLELARHAETCAECKNAVTEFREVVRFGLPLAENPFRRSVNMITSRPDPGAKERFLRRASREGIVFSSELRRSTASRRPGLTWAVAGTGAVAAIVLGALFVSNHPGLPARQPSQLSQQSSTLEATISSLEQVNAQQQRETERLRAQVAKLAAATNHGGDRTPSSTPQLASVGAQSVEETESQQRAQEKLLDDTKAELAALKKARASDLASIAADRIQINELSDQLKTAKADTTNMQRQLATAADVPDVMGARQLHVVDVRDSGPDGKPGKAFGRIFLTEGKSLVFYAFDLSNPGKNGSKKTYQVWGQKDGKPSSLRSLGFLNVDSKTQQRWVLKTNDAATFREINSLFVTVEPRGGAKTPGDQRMLFAYLGEPNHP
jgi:anti-sigma factor RsiW